MTRIILLLVLIISLGLSTHAQDRVDILKKSDFELTSAYYRGDLLFKNSIYYFLNKYGTSDVELEKLLLDKCLIKEQNLEQKDDSVNNIINALNTLGNKTYCITEINNNGDILYRLTYSASLHITIETGVLKRI